MKMMLTRTLAVAALLFMGACAGSSVSNAQLEQAKGVSYGLETTYKGVLQTATVWADKKNRCAPSYPLPAPLCSTAQGVLNVEAKRLVARSAIDRLDAVIATAGVTPNAIAVAVSAAQNAVGLYQDATKGTSP